MKNYFSNEELQCPCCKKLIFNSSFRVKLNHARHIANIPFLITSGYRCLAYNKKIGANSTSSHPKGMAVDISIDNSHQRYMILATLLQIGFTRIGIGPDFIHVDNDSEKSQKVCWDYYPKEEK